MKHAFKKFMFSGLAILVGFYPALAQNSNPHHAKHQRYKLVDIGTFGGPQGNVNPEGNGGPYINHRGVVVGQTQNTTPLTSPLGFVCFPGPNVNHAFKHVHGKTIDLGALEPAEENCSDALGINNRGEIAGLSSSSVVDPLLGMNESRAVIWKDGELLDLGTFGGNDASASSINNRGQVAGFALNDIPDPFSLFGFFFNGSSNSTQTRAFLWENGKMKDLGTLGGPDAQAFPGNINERGQVPGASYTNDILSPLGLPTVHPFLWDGRKMIDMGSLGGDFAFPVALTNHAEAIGISFLADDVSQHGFLWSNGVMHDLGTLGGTIGEANAINEKGDVVGDAYFPGDAVRHALLWRNGSRKDLGVLPGDICSAAWWINSQGQVIGNSGQCGFGIRSFIWENGEMANLNDLVTPKSDVVLDDAIMIADNGDIAINGRPAGCDDHEICGHPYLLIPIGDCDDDLSTKITAQQSSPDTHGTPAKLPLHSLRVTRTVDPTQRTLDRMRLTARGAFRRSD